jgi:hypothetical protein
MLHRTRLLPPTFAKRSLCLLFFLPFPAVGCFSRTNFGRLKTIKEKMGKTDNDDPDLLSFPYPMDACCCIMHACDAELKALTVCALECSLHNVTPQN